MTATLKPSPQAVSVARFVRDLLTYNEQLIKFDRTMTQQDDLNTGYIVVNTSAQAATQSRGKSFDGEAEVMKYSATMQQSVVLEFYGDAAYTNANDFLLLSDSQAARDLKRSLGLTVHNVRQMTDVKQLLGSQYGNRVHVEFNITYTPSRDVATLRIDSTQFEFKIED